MQKRLIESAQQIKFGLIFWRITKTHFLRSLVWRCLTLIQEQSPILRNTKIGNKCISSDQDFDSKDSMQEESSIFMKAEEKQGGLILYF